MIRDLWREIMTPSRRDEAPYLWLLIFVGHGMVGAAVYAPLEAWVAGWALPVLRLAVSAGYWLIKERGDLRRGGTFRDGLVDSVGVHLGTFYGSAWWPAAMLSAAGAGVIIREYLREA